MFLGLNRVLLSGASSLIVAGSLYASGHGWSFGHGAASAFGHRAMGSGASSAMGPSGISAGASSSTTSPGAAPRNGSQFGSQFSRGAAALGRSNRTFGTSASSARGANSAGSTMASTAVGKDDSNSAGNNLPGKRAATGTARALQQQQLNNSRILQHREGQAQHLRDISQRNGNQRLLDTANRMQQSAQANDNRRTSQLQKFPSSSGSASDRSGGRSSTAASSGSSTGTSSTGNTSTGGQTTTPSTSTSP